MSKTKRSIIKIDEKKCNGCGLCIPNCPEGAIQIIDGKARLISDLFCDGLGACLGHCPQGAISIEEREAEDYRESRVMENIVKQGKNVIKAHLGHLKGHNQTQYLKEAIDFLKKKNIANPMDEDVSHANRQPCGCPGAKVMDMREERLKADLSPEALAKGEVRSLKSEVVSQLRQWPVQIMLVPPSAPYFDNADLLIASDCVPFAYPDFHNDFLKGKILLIGCPKLDDVNFYQEKFTQIFQKNNIKSITYLHMEVPCCSGMIGAIKSAISDSGKNIPFKDVTVTIEGEIK